MRKEGRRREEGKKIKQTKYIHMRAYTHTQTPIPASSLAGVPSCGRQVLQARRDARLEGRDVRLRRGHDDRRLRCGPHLLQRGRATALQVGGGEWRIEGKICIGKSRTVYFFPPPSPQRWMTSPPSNFEHMVNYLTTRPLAEAPDLQEGWIRRMDKKNG